MEHKKEEKNKKGTLSFKVNIPALLKEVVECGLSEKMGLLKTPINEFRRQLGILSEIAIKINDDELNLWCLKQAIYQQGDPYSKDYNPKYIEELEKKLSKK